MVFDDERLTDLKQRLLAPAHDLEWLLNRGYPKKSSLVFVGNHYQLNAWERDILFRSIFPRVEALDAKRKKIRARDLKGRSLGIDGFNVLITLENALSGELLIRGNDGFIRDTAGVFRRWRRSEKTLQALDMILRVLKRYEVKKTIFVLDAPFSGSRELAGIINQNLQKMALSGEAILQKQVETWLSKFSDIVATSDSRLIRRVKKAFDLTGHLTHYTLKIRSLKLVSV